MNNIQNYGMINYQSFKGGKSELGKFVQKKSHDISVALESLKRDTVKNIGGCDIQRYGKEEVCQFRTFPGGTKVITNTNGQKRIMTLSGDEVVVNEGGKIRVLSDETFIKTYEPVCTEHWRGGLADRGMNATRKSGTNSYIDICDRVIGREYKKLCEELEQKGIKLKSYVPACDMCSRDAEVGEFILEVNGKDIKMTHPIESNSYGFMKMVKDILINGKKPKDFNNGYWIGEIKEKFANNFLNEISPASVV